MTEKRSVIIIDDESNIRNLLSRILSLEGFEVNTFATAKEGLNSFDRESYDVALIDVKLPDIDGIELTRLIREKSPDTEIIVMTAYATIKDGVEAIRRGAMDYIEKGRDEEEIILKVKQAAEKAGLKHKIKQLQSRIDKNLSFSSITGKSKQFSDCIELAKKVAATNTTVLLLGETGTASEKINLS